MHSLLIKLGLGIDVDEFGGSFHSLIKLGLGTVADELADSNLRLINFGPGIDNYEFADCIHSLIKLGHGIDDGELRYWLSVFRHVLLLHKPVSWTVGLLEEFVMENSEKIEDIRADSIKPQFYRFVFPDGHGAIYVREFRPVSESPASTTPSSGRNASWRFF